MRSGDSRSPTARLTQERREATGSLASEPLNNYGNGSYLGCPDFSREKVGSTPTCLPTFSTRGMAMNCGRTSTCGGMASSGPGDSDWFPCEEHAADYPYFGMIYTAQIHAAYSDRPVLKTREECASYTKKYLSKKG
jgi:hypothetical protein